MTVLNVSRAIQNSARSTRENTRTSDILPPGQRMDPATPCGLMHTANMVLIEHDRIPTEITRCTQYCTARKVKMCFWPATLAK
jgi:hypothetical protein